MSHSNEPIRPEELEALFAPLAPELAAPCALAVSGGSDSTALMVLFAEWLRRAGHDLSTHTVLTVDHGLRWNSVRRPRAVAAHAPRARIPPRHARMA